MSHERLTKEEGRARRGALGSVERSAQGQELVGLTLRVGRRRDGSSDLPGRSLELHGEHDARDAVGGARRDGRACLLPLSPCVGIKRLRHQPAPGRAVSVEQIEAIPAKAEGLRDAALVSLMAYAGLRPEEASALRWKTSATTR